MSRFSNSPTLVTEIICPRCESVLEADANRCPACGAATAAPPETVKPQITMIDRPWLIALVILHVGLLGIPLYWKTKYPVHTRVLIVTISIVYTIAAVLGIVWGCAQIFRMLHGA
jgi:hypothetical protein